MQLTFHTGKIYKPRVGVQVFTHRDDGVSTPAFGVSESIPEGSLPHFPKEKGFPMAQEAVRAQNKLQCSSEGNLPKAQQLMCNPELSLVT